MENVFMVRTHVKDRNRCKSVELVACLCVVENVLLTGMATCMNSCIKTLLTCPVQSLSKG